MNALGAHTGCAGVLAGIKRDAAQRRARVVFSGVFRQVGAGLSAGAGLLPPPAASRRGRRRTQCVTHASRQGPIS